MEIQLSPEYVETLCSWLEEWGDNPDSLAIPQFLAKHGISWKYFKAMKEAAPLLENTFEVVIAKLHTRWLEYAFKKDELSKHLTSILMRYLRVYDDHAYEVETKAKQQIAEAASGVPIKVYESEDFKRLKLSGRFEEIYNSNVNRRRSSSKAK